MSILLIDNNDSFTHILAQVLRSVDDENNEIIIRNYDELKEMPMDYSHYVISPGPGIATEYSKYPSWLDQLQDKNVLGVCLGMQLMALWKGYRLFQKDEIIHGKEALLHIVQRNEYTKGIEDHSTIALYHSWAIDRESGSYWEEIALDENDTLMMMSRGKMMGLQFHPESFLSRMGPEILKNWLKA